MNEFEVKEEEFLFTENTLDEMQAHLERKHEWDIAIAFYCLREKINNLEALSHPQPTKGEE
jgi:hypothetical protein